MRRRATIAILLAASAALTGCGGAASGSSATGTAHASSSAPTSTAVSTTTPPSTSAAPAVTMPALPSAGTTVQASFGSVTYFGQKRPAAPSAPAPQQEGTEWVAIDVQVCINPTTPGDSISSTAWTVTDASNGQSQPASDIYSQFPAPEYPFNGYIDPGTCVRGWIVYAVVKGQSLVRVRYFPGNATAPVATWTA